MTVSRAAPLRRLETRRCHGAGPTLRSGHRPWRGPGLRGAFSLGVRVRVRSGVGRFLPFNWAEATGSLGPSWLSSESPRLPRPATLALYIPAELLRPQPQTSTPYALRGTPPLGRERGSPCSAGRSTSGGEVTAPAFPFPPGRGAVRCARQRPSLRPPSLRPPARRGRPCCARRSPRHSRAASPLRHRRSGRRLERLLPAARKMVPSAGQLALLALGTYAACCASPAPGATPSPLSAPCVFLGASSAPA